MLSRQAKVLGKEGLKKVGKARVCIVGLGSIGSPMAQMLARSGVGWLKLIDRDYVEPPNMDSQLYSAGDIGNAKAEACRSRIREINPDIKTEMLAVDLNSETVSYLGGCDIIFDCTDNMAARHVINEFCIKNSVPWVHSAATRKECVCAPFVPGKACFACVYGEMKIGAETCDTEGLLMQTAVVVAGLASSLGLDMVLGKRVEAKLYRLSLETMEFEGLSIRKNRHCTRCVKKRFESLEKPLSDHMICAGACQLYRRRQDFNELHRRLPAGFEPKMFEGVFHIKNGRIEISIFADGRAIVKNAKNLSEARSAYSKIIGD